MADLRIGCSGWAYKSWNGPFYPPGTRDRDRLACYARVFDTAEINASFYRLPSPSAVAGWAGAVPAGFVFAWKVSRFITHNKKLRDCAEAVELVFSRMRGLGAALGPALVQLPPMLRRDEARLAEFLAILPPGRRAVEFRHPSWYEPAVFRVLSDHDAALCISDHHDAPSPWERTASFVYVRGHGPGGRYRGRYAPAELRTWTERATGWMAQGHDAYVYFDNDVEAAAPADAAAMQALAGALKPPET